MESVTLQMLELELGKYKILDLQKKIDIAVNVSERIGDHLFVERMDHAQYMDKISSLTGVNTGILQHICKLEGVSRKFEEWSKEADVFARRNVLYSTMKKYLHDLYLKDRVIPTKSAIINMFQLRYRPEFQLNFNKFFTATQVAGTQLSIVVEKPEIVLTRHKYLRKKMALVEQAKVFVYIEDINFITRQGTYQMSKSLYNSAKCFVLAVSPVLGYVSSIHCCRSTETHLRYWIEEEVIPKLPPGCVLVFEDGMFEELSSLPESHATKQDMIDWLQQQDIAHNPRSHRAELFALIETYKKSKRDITRAEQILQRRGHIVLCRQEGVNFEYCEPLWKKLNEILEVKKSKGIFANKMTKSQLPFAAKRVVSLIQKEYWEELDNKLSYLEQNAFKRDLEIEETIDKLMTMATCEELCPAELEFDDYCEAMGHEYILGTVSERLKCRKPCKLCLCSG